VAEQFVEGLFGLLKIHMKALAGTTLVAGQTEALKKYLVLREASLALVIDVVATGKENHDIKGTCVCPPAACCLLLL
jgi:hypothetical protein